MSSLNSTPRTFSEEMRTTYLGAFPHTLFTAFIWLVAGTMGVYTTKSQAIIFFLVAGMFIFPGGELIRKFMRVPSTLSKDNKFPQLFTLLAFTIPISYPLIYLICKNEINLFFSSFTILVGAHYLPFVFGYKMPTFGLLSLLLVSVGTAFSIFYPDQFSVPAFITGGILLVFGFLHFLLIKKNLL